MPSRRQVLRHRQPASLEPRQSRSPCRLGLETPPVSAWFLLGGENEITPIRGNPDVEDACSALALPPLREGALSCSRQQSNRNRLPLPLAAIERTKPVHLLDAVDKDSFLIRRSHVFCHRSCIRLGQTQDEVIGDRGIQ